MTCSSLVVSFPPALALPLLVCCLFCLKFIALYKFFLNFSCHDAPHLVVDPLLLIRVFNKSPVQGVDSDDLEPLEKPLVVDLVVPSLEEVVLVRVVVLDCDEPRGRLLAKEGASMGNDTYLEVGLII